MGIVARSIAARRRDVGGSGTTIALSFVHPRASGAYGGLAINGFSVSDGMTPALDDGTPYSAQYCEHAWNTIRRIRLPFASTSANSSGRS